MVARDNRAIRRTELTGGEHGTGLLNEMMTLLKSGFPKQSARFDSPKHG